MATLEGQKAKLLEEIAEERAKNSGDREVRHVVQPCSYS
jgi:hypothetical protein